MMSGESDMTVLKQWNPSHPLLKFAATKESAHRYIDKLVAEGAVKKEAAPFIAASEEMDYFTKVPLLGHCEGVSLRMWKIDKEEGIHPLQIKDADIKHFTPNEKKRLDESWEQLGEDGRADFDNDIEKFYRIYSLSSIDQLSLLITSLQNNTSVPMTVTLSNPATQGFKSLEPDEQVFVYREARPPRFLTIMSWRIDGDGPANLFCTLNPKITDPEEIERSKIIALCFGMICEMLTGCFKKIPDEEKAQYSFSSLDDIFTVDSIEKIVDAFNRFHISIMNKYYNL